MISVMLAIYEYISINIHFPQKNLARIYSGPLNILLGPLNGLANKNEIRI